MHEEKPLQKPSMHRSLHSCDTHIHTHTETLATTAVLAGGAGAW